MDTIILNGKQIKYRYKKKQGLPIVFLHGYLETMDVFCQFIDTQIPETTTLILDIPGHGCSDAINPSQTMQQIASHIVLLFDYLKIETFVVYGHSMGGYVAQSIAGQIPNRVKMLGLLHSNVYADTDEKKKNRLREIEAIEQGKLSTIAQAFMPNIVADFNRERLNTVISNWIERAKTMQPSGVVSCLNAMMQRPDNSKMLDGTIPIHLITGDSDTFLISQMVDKMRVGKAVQTVTLIEKCGHASFIEQPEKLNKAIRKCVAEFIE